MIFCYTNTQITHKQTFVNFPIGMNKVSIYVKLIDLTQALFNWSSNLISLLLTSVLPVSLQEVAPAV